MESQQENSPTPPQQPAPAGFARIEDLYGYFPRVTTTPTWTPSKFQDSFALDTTNGIFYYYDFDNMIWRSTPNLSSDIIDALNAATSPSGANAFVTFSDLPSAPNARDFADGSDGTATLDGTNTYAFMSKSGSTYTLTRDAYLTSLTVNNGATLKTGSFRLYGNGTLTNNGTIDNSGSASVASAHGAGAPTGTLGSSTAGADGATGATSSPSSTTNSLGGSGGAAAGGSFTPGSAGTATPAVGHPMIGYTSELMAIVTSSLAVVFFTGGAGGAGGTGANSTGTNPIGGGGGGGGGIVFIAFKILINNGTISANGGAGGNGTAGTGSQGANYGGGGGGGGGAVVTVTQSYTNNGSITANGGAFGSGAAALGSSGSNGHVYNITV